MSKAALGSIFLAALILTDISARPEYAQPISEDECARRQPGMTSPLEMVTCTSDIAGSQARLRNAYSTLAKRVGKRALPELAAAQRAWLAYRNAQCAFDAGEYAGSTMHYSSIITCTADMNRTRAAELVADFPRCGR